MDDRLTKIGVGLPGKATEPGLAPRSRSPDGREAPAVNARSTARIFFFAL